MPLRAERRVSPFLIVVFKVTELSVYILLIRDGAFLTSVSIVLEKKFA